MSTRVFQFCEVASFVLLYLSTCFYSSACRVYKILDRLKNIYGSHTCITFVTLDLSIKILYGIPFRMEYPNSPLSFPSCEKLWQWILEEEFIYLKWCCLANFWELGSPTVIMSLCFMYHHKEMKTASAAAKSVSIKLQEVWRRANIHVMMENIRAGIHKLYKEYQNLSKEKSRNSATANTKRHVWKGNIEELFDTA